MKRWNVVVALLALAGLVAAPAYAEMRLTVTGFIDNHLRYSQNLSANDDIVTDVNLPDVCRPDGCDEENEFRGRTRGRIFFNIAANEYSKAVFGFEIDQVWGALGDDNVPQGQRDAEGFDLGIDNMSVEVKWLYVDIKIPNTPVSFRAGGLPLQADRLKGSCILLCMDVGGVDVEIAFDPQLILSVYFANFEEDDDRVVTAANLGDDYFGGLTLMTTPIKGLKANLLFAFEHIQGPSLGGSATSRLTSAGQDQEDRWWVGVEGEWRMANFLFSPTFIYGGGTREFLVGDDIDLSTFIVDVRAGVTFGPLTVTGKFVYTPGNDFNDDLGPGGDDINVWQSIAVDTVNRTMEWFEIFGFNIDTTSPSMFTNNESRSLRANVSFDQFGMLHGALRADFKAHQKITVSGTVGFFSTTEDVGPPSGGRSTVNSASRNYTGEDKYLGTELDVFLRYALFKGVDVDLYFAHAFTGDALDLCAEGTGVGTGVACARSSAQDITAAGTRLLYRF
jgi:hypothetical protein